MKPGVIEDNKEGISQRYELPLSDLTDRLAHKLRNPLSVITTASSQLESITADQLKDDEKSMLQAIIIAADRMEEILREYVYYASLPPNEIEMIDLNSVCRAELKDIAFEFKGVSSEFQADSQVLLIECDQYQLRKIIAGILRNGFQSIKGRGKVAVRTFLLDNKACIQVTDDGEGILPQNSNLVYTPFYSTWAGQIGLGLPIADKLIRAVGGGLNISERNGGGTEVTVELPLKYKNRSND